jgi:chromosomal replication initiation ATPase DnaA
VKTQLRLNLDREPAYSAESFVISAANHAAASLVLDGGPSWPAGVLVLSGPSGAGKTHLARMWAETVNASLAAPPLANRPGGPLLIEDLDRDIDEEGLFHLLNHLEPEAPVLLTTRSLPSQWTVALPDLRSRLNALTVAELGPPDDAILQGALAKLFAERNIRPAPDLIPYLVPRMERSVDAARAIVAALDEAAAQKKREVNRTLAIQVLEIDSVTRDLFDGET